MAPSAELKTLVSQLPDHDRNGKLTNIDKDKVEQTVARIHAGGRGSIVGVIDMLVEPGKGNDIKPRYAIHLLAVHACKLGDKQPSEYARAVAAQIDGRAKGVQKLLIRQLQVAGGREVAPTLGKLLRDPVLCGYASRALVSIRHGAAEQLRAALGKVKGASRLRVILALAVLGDRKSMGTFRQAVTDGDREIRITAAWALANLADAASVRALLTAADGCTGWERIKHTKACLLLAENLLAAGNRTAARRIYTHLRQSRTKPAEKYIRQAAARGLAAVT